MNNSLFKFPFLHFGHLTLILSGIPKKTLYDPHSGHLLIASLPFLRCRTLTIF